MKWGIATTAGIFPLAVVPPHQMEDLGSNVENRIANG